MNKKGFTLLELLVVVLIIGILAAIALPKYSMFKRKTELIQYITLINKIDEAQERYYLSNNQYSNSLLELDIDLPSNFEIVEKSSYSLAYPDGKKNPKEIEIYTYGTANRESAVQFWKYAKLGGNWPPSYEVYHYPQACGTTPNVKYIIQVNPNDEVLNKIALDMGGVICQRVGTTWNIYRMSFK